MIEYGFQGCIRDIQIMQRKYPTEIWAPLHWTDAIHNELAFLNWEGCPINLDRGTHFMGQGEDIVVMTNITMLPLGKFMAKG